MSFLDYYSGYTLGHNAIIENIEVGFNKVNIPCIIITVRVIDGEERIIKPIYSFIKSDKEFSYKVLSELLSYYDIKINRKNILESLNQVIGKKVKIIRTPYDWNKYVYLPK